MKYIPSRTKPGYRYQTHRHMVGRWKQNVASVAYLIILSQTNLAKNWLTLLLSGHFGGLEAACIHRITPVSAPLESSRKSKGHACGLHPLSPWLLASNELADFLCDTSLSKAAQRT